MIHSHGCAKRETKKQVFTLQVLFLTNCFPSLCATKAFLLCSPKNSDVFTPAQDGAQTPPTLFLRWECTQEERSTYYFRDNMVLLPHREDVFLAATACCASWPRRLQEQLTYTFPEFGSFCLSTGSQTVNYFLLQ